MKFISAVALFAMAAEATSLQSKPIYFSYEEKLPAGWTPPSYEKQYEGDEKTNYNYSPVYGKDPSKGPVAYGKGDDFRPEEHENLNASPKYGKDHRRGPIGYGRTDEVGPKPQPAPRPARKHRGGYNRGHRGYDDGYGYGGYGGRRSYAPVYDRGYGGYGGYDRGYDDYDRGYGYDDYDRGYAVAMADMAVDTVAMAADMVAMAVTTTVDMVAMVAMAVDMEAITTMTGEYDHYDAIIPR